MKGKRKRKERIRGEKKDQVKVREMDKEDTEVKGRSGKKRN